MVQINVVVVVEDNNINLNYLKEHGHTSSILGGWLCLSYILKKL